MGIMIRRSSTRLLRSWKLRKPDLQARSIVEQLGLQLLHGVIQALDRLELAIDDVIQQPVQQVPTPNLTRSGFSSRRWTTAPIPRPSSLRTVISAYRVMKAASSLVASSPVAESSRAP